PGKPIGVPREKVVEHDEVVADDAARPLEHAVPRAQRDERQDFARRAVTDGRVVLQRREPCAKGAIARRDPADAKSRQPEWLRHHTEADSTLRALGRGW